MQAHETGVSEAGQEPRRRRRGQEPLYAASRGWEHLISVPKDEQATELTIAYIS